MGKNMKIKMCELNSISATDQRLFNKKYYHKDGTKDIIKWWEGSMLAFSTGGKYNYSVWEI